MRFPPLVEARFVQRLNRFAATVELDGREVTVHVANSGRMHELLQPGNLCYLTEQPAAHRKTAYDLTLVAIDRIGTGSVREPSTPYAGDREPAASYALVSADARLPNALVWEAWREGTLPHLGGYPSARREVSYHDSRLDLVLESQDSKCYVEVKAVTLVQEGIARFPDAPTERGRKHVSTLVRAVKEGHRAAAVFVVQRDDAVALSPYDANDPDFGEALREAVSAGVEAYAFTCAVSRESISLAGEAPVLL
ncbi:MAG: DNA/RNA nuclease SfsA [Chloroflexota bacterium]|nr:DNA/RNA nuclease SfsA [Chloroflexota bacterium]MDE2968761.1 DNA/RNA nuclease SfsA [Chloroflexota bacterium]